MHSEGALYAAVALSMAANSDLMIGFCRATARAMRSTTMFYRRKLLLGLLQSIGRPVNKVELQKYLLCTGFGDQNCEPLTVTVYAIHK